MDWQAKSNVRDAGLQATKNMDPNQPAPAVPTDPAKKAAYDAAIKNMDPNQTAPAAPAAKPVAQQQAPAAPPAPKQPTAQNPAQPATPPDSSDKLADAAHAAFLKHDPTPQDIDLINRARTTLPSWQQPGVKSMFGEPPAQQGNAAAFQPKLGPDGKPLPVAGTNGERTYRDLDYGPDPEGRPDIFGGNQRISSTGGVSGSKSMFENSELSRILTLAKW
jgi:hypothetical protein